MSRPLTGSGTASSAARTTGRPRNASHRSSVSKSTSNTTPHLSACHVPSRTPLVSAASIRAESCCSCHRKAETSPCRTSIDHHSATIAMVRLRPRTATPACPARAATRRDPSRPPSPNGQPGNVSPKATRKLSTQTHALPTLHSRRNEQAWFSCCADQPVRRCTVQCPGMTGAKPAGLAAELGPETSSGQPDPCQGASCASVDRRPHPRDLRCGDASKPGHARSTAPGARLLALDRRRRSGRGPRHMLVDPVLAAGRACRPAS